MAIVSSKITEDALYTVRCAQHDRTEERRSVRERHVDHLGNVYERAYRTSDLRIDVEAGLAAHAKQLEADLATQEIAANVKEVLEGSGADLKYQHSTKDQTLEALRAKYKDLTGIELHRAALWFSGHLRTEEVKTLFAVTDAQVTTVQSKWSAMGSRLSALEAEKGS